MTNETVICTYRVRPQAEDEFVTLLARHWHTLHDLGFVTDGESLAIWEPMEPLLEDRDGRPKWEFPHFERVRFGS